MKAYFILAAVWTLYFCLHSVMASNKAKHFVKKHTNHYFKLYRIAFNLISLIFFCLILYFQFSIEAIYVFPPTTVVKILGSSIAIAGLLTLFLAFKSFDTKEFMGVQQLNTDTKNVKKEDSKLVKTGFYGFVRHPLYLATIILIAGIFIFLPTLSNLVFFTVVILYLPFGIYFEEKKLISEFGEDYLQYQKEVKAVIPFMF